MVWVWQRWFLLSDVNHEVTVGDWGLQGSPLDVERLSDPLVAADSS